MTTSAYPATVDKLLSIFHAAFDSTTGAATVRITEGPGVSSATNQQLIWVGVEASDEFSPPGKGGSGQVLWATMGTNHSRDERFSVNCVADAWAGNYDPPTLRAQAFALFGAAITAVTSDPSIGRPGGVLALESYTFDYSVITASEGASGRIEFVLNFRARI